MNKLIHIFLTFLLLLPYGNGYCLAPGSGMPPAENPSLHEMVNQEIDTLVSKIQLKQPERYNPSCMTINMGFYCPLDCAHCFLLHDLKKMRPMNREQLETIAKKVNDLSDVHEAEISGGEPFAYFDKLVYLVEKLDKKFIYINTSGYWAENQDEIRTKLKRLVASKKSGKVTLSISVDDNHEVPVEKLADIIEVVCRDSELKEKINITLNVTTERVGGLSEKLRDLVVELSRRELITLREGDLNTLVLFASDIPLKIDFVFYMLEIRKGPMDFVGNAINSPSELQPDYPGGPNLTLDNFSITPDGEVSIHPYLMDLISVGNIYSEGSTFNELRMKTYNHPILYMLGNTNFNLDALFGYVYMLNSNSDLGELYRKQIMPEAKLRILLEDPLMRYCLTLITLKLMCVNDMVCDQDDFPEIVSLDMEAFLVRIMTYYRKVSRSTNFIPISDFHPDDTDSMPPETESAISL